MNILSFNFKHFSKMLKLGMTGFFYGYGGWKMACAGFACTSHLPPAPSTANSVIPNGVKRNEESQEAEQILKKYSLLPTGAKP